MFRILRDGASYSAQGYGEVRFFFSPACGSPHSVGQPCHSTCQGLGTIYSPALLDQQDLKGHPFQSPLESHIHSIPSGVGGWAAWTGIFIVLYSESWYISAHHIGKETALRDLGICQGQIASDRAWIEIYVCHHMLCPSPYTVTLRTAAERITTLLFIEDHSMLGRAKCLTGIESQYAGR